MQRVNLIYTIYTTDSYVAGLSSIITTLPFNPRTFESS